MAVIAQQPVNEKEVTAQKGAVSSTGNSLMQGSVGPTALAAPSIYEILAMYNKIVQLDQKQQGEMLQTQAKEAKGQASAIVKAAVWLGVSMIVGGALSIAGSALGYGASNLMGSGEYNESSEQLQSSETDMQSMKSLDSMGQETEQASPIGGPSQENTAVMARKEELLQGQYSEVDENDPVTKQAIAEIKRNPEEYQGFQDDLNSRMDTKSRDINSQTSKMLRVNNSRQMVNNLVQQGTGAISSGTQGVGQWKQGEYKSQETLEGTAAGLSGSRQQANGEAMGSAIQSAQRQPGVLQQMRSTNKAAPAA
ncbi:MAG: hypothetical protein KR126chlam1_00835 [Chlamydiae bacterium]|nr:hypothetical protein [Chlamydiota bacterium]